MPDQHSETGIGIGATDEFSLRVSVATLVRVLFENPENGETMLALERRATLCANETGRVVNVKSQPFGGALRIYDLRRLKTLIGDFHFDSEASRAEQDFRLFIRSSAWGAVQEFCLRQLNPSHNPVLESDPRRELAEEFTDTLKVSLSTNQFAYKLVGTIMENDPAPTQNLAARGYPTARIYHVFEARILDASLSQAMMHNIYSDEEICELALENAQDGGPGWANAILTLPLNRVNKFYSTISPELLNAPVLFQGHKLDETVAAILDVDVPKYERVLS